ncbi:MAG: glycosyltransferase, partial [Thermoanaerobaculia bacterium]
MTSLPNSPTEPGPSGAPSLDCSVLVPVLDEAGTVLELARRVREAIVPLGLTYEIIFIDDGS